MEEGEEKEGEIQYLEVIGIFSIAFPLNLEAHATKLESAIVVQLGVVVHL
jgi:hypothetical protein